MPIVVKARNFASEVLEARGPVLVDFYGEQCVPCRLLRPILLELSSEYEGVKICMFNTDRELRETDEDYEDKFAVLAAYDVMSLPTVLLFRGGELVSTIIGLHTKEELFDIFRELNIKLKEIPKPPEEKAEAAGAPRGGGAAAA